LIGFLPPPPCTHLQSCRECSDDEFSDRSNKKRKLLENVERHLDKRWMKIPGLTNKVKKIQIVAACLAGNEVSRGASMLKDHKETKTDEIYDTVRWLLWIVK